ncbi:Na+/H+ antiporter [Edaphosphingomonas haloaromaticamans]|uniref:Sodium, potassium, lithium and rubidium/H(+) antiporter n=1 Tax=Edaphosphingomonas haloaromaticamans TaxID=653954 RepID=A0A1S1HLM8_9SPHN|nr:MULTISPECIES: Na+/H+ antiporter [Sphingomonas]MDX3886195.1 Na+/H+ antiporter [Sphingomonas sp.]OHT22316.1 Sodium, potassium, lithium and rubidium/H(+) antiporter [Sphingomonas haloaromaticamans]
MTAITITLVLLASVVASSIVARLMARRLPLPLPFVQIALGGLLASLFDVHIGFEPEVFLLLFIAPLLYLDGWRIPSEGLLGDKWTICALAFGLVLFTVAGAGYFIHWIIPAVPLTVAFALAAVLSPTDAVALSAIAARTPIPRRLLHILEGEALLNDASGLVCMRFAVVATLTGTFSFVDASATFLWLACAGAAAGVAVAVLANAGKDWISRRYGEEPGSQILISLLIPFTAYLLATQISASGILAAVAAGIAMNYEERTGNALPVTRIRRAAVWDAIQFAANGAIFVLLGYQLPAIVEGAEHVVREAGHQGGLWLPVYVLAINTVLLLLRAIWVWITLRLFLFGPARAERKARKPGWRLTMITALAGVRGALTLSGIMTLPLALADGTPFPARDLAIFLAAGVIIASLIVANLGLPALLRGLELPPDISRHREEDAARVAAAQAAIDAIERSLRAPPATQMEADLQMQAGARLIEQYRRRIDARSPNEADPDFARRSDEIERRLRLIGLAAERNEYYRFARNGKLHGDLTNLLVREIDLLESRFTRN